MNSFTRGEWKSTKVDNGHYLVGCPSGLVADVYNNIEGEQANANLIAAAPELYEALREAQEVMREMVDWLHPDCPTSSKEATNHIGQALSKAEGTTPLKDG